MTSQKAIIVDLVKALNQIVAPGGKYLEVSFASNPSAYLNVNHPAAAAWERVLNSRRQRVQPVSVEILKASKHIESLYVPYSTHIGSLTPTNNNDLEVDLVDSHAVHYLRSSHPDFDKILAALLRATNDDSLMLVTENLHREIIDVRKDTFFKGDKGIPPPRCTIAAKKSSAIPVARANTLFALLQGMTCPAAAAAAPCIPFLYVGDGCFARAHEMCRLLIDEGEFPRKTWAHRSGAAWLNPLTASEPTCEVKWKFHCAPILEVDVASGPAWQVFDPSMFDQFVTLDDWRDTFRVPWDAQESGPEVYRLSNMGYEIYDYDYSDTADYLQDCRELLDLLTAAYGPPPYAHCSAAP